MEAVLFSSPHKPYPLIFGISPYDQQGFRFSRGQDIFTLEEHSHFYGLHLIAQNLDCPAVVLEYPTREAFIEEVKKGYPFVGLTFLPFTMDILLEQCEIVRRYSPKSKIVLGGYGVICIDRALPRGQQLGKIADYVCQGEGVSFMRDLLGMPKKKQPRSLLPLCGARLPWLWPNSRGIGGYILSGLGCRNGCPFCFTSNFYKKNYVEVLDAKGIFSAMVDYWKNKKLMDYALIMDENIMAERKKVDELGRLIREDTRFGLEKLNYLCFGSVNEIARYDIEELLLNGIDAIWIGVESLYSDLPKRQGADLEGLFNQLHGHGIKTVGSTIVGMDFHAKENIQADMDFYCRLSPTFQQISPLTVLYPTPLWRSLNREGRVKEIDWAQYSLYGETFVPKNFEFQELLKIVEDTYIKSYRQNGPAILRVIDAELNGLIFCQKSKNPLLREKKAKLYKNRCETNFSLIDAIKEFAPSEAVRQKALAVEEKYLKNVGTPDDTERALSRYILKKAREAKNNGAGKDYGGTSEIFRRYYYSNGVRDSSGVPYQVEYPG